VSCEKRTSVNRSFSNWRGNVDELMSDGRRAENSVVCCNIILSICWEENISDCQVEDGGEGAIAKETPPLSK